MEVVGQTLKGVFERQPIQGSASLFANSWGSFAKYLMKRNRGYFQRKFLNLFNEVIEFSCIALVLNVSVLKTLILVPLVHILIGYLAEFHWQLYRALPEKMLKRRWTPVDLALWLLSAALMMFFAGWILNQHASDPIVRYLIPIRFVAVLVQLAIAPAIARMTTMRRVRPNVPLIWGGAMTTWALCLIPAFWARNIEYVFWVTAIFNLNKVVQELSYYRVVMKEKKRQRLILPKKVDRGVHPHHFYWMITLVTLHLGLIGVWCYRFRLEHSKLNALVVFLVVTFLDRVNGRTVRSLALDFDFLRKLRLILLRDGLIRRALAASGLVLLLTESFFLKNRNFSYPAVYGMAYVAVQGLVNQVWIYSSIGANEKKTHPAARVVVFQLMAILSLLIRGKVGLYLFYVLSGLNLVVSITGLFYRQKKEAFSSGYWVRYEWDPVVSNRGEFWNWLADKGISGFSIDRKVKALFVKDREEWIKILKRFPLNIKDWRKIQKLPKQKPIEIPEGANQVRCDLWGFWRYVDHSGRITDEEGRHLHFTHRDWKSYSYYLGGKRSWKMKMESGSTILAGPTKLEGDEMWLQSN